MPKISKKRRRLLIQIAEYMASGGAWFWSGYILIVWLTDPLGLFVANFIGNAVGITLNFILERYWVSKTNRPAKFGIAARRYIIYTAINAFGLNYLILYYLRKHGIQVAIGQFIAAGFFTVWNYVWYKLYVFKGMSSPPRRTRHHA